MREAISNVEEIRSWPGARRYFDGLGESSTAGPAPQSVTYGLSSRDDLQPSAGDARRKRVARPVEYLEERALDDLVTPKRGDENGRWKSAGLGALRGFAEGVARTGNIAGGVGGAGVGAVHGAVRPASDEQAAQGRQTNEDVRRYRAAREIEAVGEMGVGVQPRGGSPAPAPHSASSPTPTRKYTADEVRERARASGKDPEAAVNAARQGSSEGVAAPCPIS